MQNLSNLRCRVRELTAGFGESDRKRFSLTFGSFLDSATTAMGRGTFYNSQEEQEAGVESAHRALFMVDRGVYSVALLLPGLTDHSRQIGVCRLLQNGRGQGVLPAELEVVAIKELVRSLPVHRRLKLFGRLRRERINNSRTRRLILSEILDARELEFWSVKYRTKLRVALTHAWGRRVTSILRCILAKPSVNRTSKEVSIVQQNVRRFVGESRVDRVEQCIRFIMGDEVEVTLDCLMAYRDAKHSFDRGVALPPETMEGLRSRFHQDRTSAEVLELTKSMLTTGQRMAVQRKAEQVGVEVGFDPVKYDSVRLYVYAFEMGMTREIQRALRNQAIKAASRLPIHFERVGVLLDTSQSMIGHDTQSRRPIATALALRDVLVAAAKESTVLTSDRRLVRSQELVEPSGDTELAEGLVQLLKSDPEVIFVISDGYENAPAGRFHDTVAAVRRLGIQTPIHQLTPVFAAESCGVRRLSGDVDAMPVSQPDSIGLGLLKVMMESDLERGILTLLKVTNIASRLPAT